MSSHEFDQLHHPLWANGKSTGEVLATKINGWMKKHNRQLPPSATYIGLAAGYAEAELAFADTLGITDERITLLDRKNVSQETDFPKDRSPKYLETGIFSFLDNPSQTDYTVVSAIGIEYLLFDSPEITETFISSLPRIMAPKSYITVYPFFDGETPHELWQKKGFNPIHTDGWLVYSYEKQE